MLMGLGDVGGANDAACALELSELTNRRFFRFSAARAFLNQYWILYGSSAFLPRREGVERWAEIECDETFSAREAVEIFADRGDLVACGMLRVGEDL
jgi:hypothetical protein